MPAYTRGHTPHGGDARWSMLPRRQKGELVRLIGVGVLSALFFGGAAFMTRPGQTATGTPPPSVQVEAPVAPQVQVRHVEVQAGLSAPALSPDRIAPSLKQPTPARAPLALARHSQRPPLVRRLARLFAGNGRYSVQPFPTVPPAHR